jgi:hypothetical protein
LVTSKTNEISELMKRKDIPRAGATALEDGQPDHDVRLIDPEKPSPNFFIVGAAKGGTTSMYAYLSRHPEVFMSTLKQPHYFSSFKVKHQFDNFMPVIRQSRSYQELFVGSEPYKAVGEASPSYLCDPGAAIRIKSAIPHAKIIISLRNPVQRAYSHYLMEFHEGNETLPFREALEVDENRSEKGWGVSFQYIELGLYADQVEQYLNVFGPANVLVVLFEDFVRDTPAVMEQIASFLGIDPTQYPEDCFQRVHNPFEASRSEFARMILRCRPIRVTSKRLAPKKLRSAVRDRLLFKETQKPKMDDDIRQRLAQHFAPDLERLEQVLDRDLELLREQE